MNAPSAAHDERSPKYRRGVLWKMSLAATTVALVILYFVFRSCGSALVQSQEPAALAVKHFHEQLNAGQFENICREADPNGVEGPRRGELIGLLQSVHTTLGDAGAERLVNIRTDLGTIGSVISTDYETTFTHGIAVETFGWTKEGGVLKLYRYSIQSNALILKR